MSNLSDRLKAARDALGWTVAGAAERAGVDSRQTIYNWEAGETPPTGTYLLALAQAGINPAWLLLNRGDMWDAAASEAEWRLQVVRAVARGDDLPALDELLDDLSDFSGEDGAE